MYTHTNIAFQNMYKRLRDVIIDLRRTHIIIANNHASREMQNIFWRKNDGEQANGSLLSCMDVAAIIMSRNKSCYSLIYVKYRRRNKSNGGMHMEIQFLSV